MKALPMLSDKDLDGMHEHFFAAAKSNLIRDGWLRPAAFFAFTAEDPSAAIRDAGLGHSPRIDEMTPESEAATVVGMFVIQSEREAIDALVAMHPELGERFGLARNMMKLLAKDGVLPTGETIDEMVLKTFLEAQRATYADVIAMHLRYIARKLGAYAIFKADEAWVATQTAEESAIREKEGGPEVRNIPGRREVVIVSLETRTRSTLREAFTIRENPSDEKSKILRFEDVDCSRYGELAGRFFELLDRAS